ncbi:hypothetical protein HFD88_004901 [Aspergillus terreus]|nr:hypothetical protein HFD88_004901 [Aspergillus terreus]
MRLTVELIQNSLSYINPLKDRELDLRGHKIPAIENLGIAKDQDAIDFTDNDISSLGNFPFFPRLHTLLLARNRVKHIQPTLASSVPNLTTLVLTANNMTELADLDPLRSLKKLTHLILMENPITRKEHYRYWVIWRLPTVRFLDYQKVKDAEREKARELFGTAEAPSALASKIIGIKSRTFDVPAGGADRAPADKAVRVKLTEKERKRVEKMIREARSLQEITRLEKELNEGRIPGGALGADADEMETSLITEALHPFEVFRQAGFEVDLVSETGTYQPDWFSQQKNWLSDQDHAVWEDHSTEFRSKLDRPLLPVRMGVSGQTQTRLVLQ